MDKELFKKTEGILYRYFESINVIARLNSKIEFLDSELEKIKLEIKNLNNFETDVYTNMGIDYSRDSVQTSTTSINEVERAMIKYITNLEKRYEEILEIKLKLIDDVRTTKLTNHDIEFNIKMLNDETRRFIDLKYKERKSMKWITVELFSGAESTAFRKREDVISNISHWLNIALKS